MFGQLPRCPLSFEIVLTLCQYMSEKFHTLPLQTWLTTPVNMGSGGSVIALCNCLYTNICNIFGSFLLSTSKNICFPLWPILLTPIYCLIASSSLKQVAYHKSKVLMAKRLSSLFQLAGWVRLLVATT